MKMIFAYRIISAFDFKPSRSFVFGACAAAVWIIAIAAGAEAELSDVLILGTFVSFHVVLVCLNPIHSIFVLVFNKTD